MHAVGVFGGSFNPTHVGHVELVRRIQETLAFRPLYVVPCSIQPIKGALALPAAERISMLESALAGIPGVIVSDLEASRTGPSYTIDTIRRLQALHPEARIHFVLGEDAFAGIESWHEAEALLRECAFIVVGRKGSGSEEEARAVASRHPLAETRFLDLDLPEVSASGVRELMEHGRPLSGLVPAEIENSLRNRRLRRPSA